MTQRFWELMSRYWNREISNDELSELESMLLQHPDAWLKSGMMDQLVFKKEAESSEEVTDRLMEKISLKAGGLEQQPAKQKKRWWIPVGMAAVLAGALLVYHFYNRNDGVYKEMTTEMGMKTKKRLSDGSVVWLNAGSRLRYPEKFSSGQREVYLSGEGYFEVKASAGHPFIIHTSKMDIQVLGTEFNVRSYDDEDFAETALIRGAVEVAMKETGNNAPVLLKPNQKIIWKKPAAAVSAGVGLKKTADKAVVERQPLSTVSGDSSLIEEVAWINNQFVFYNETLASLSTRLERWYGVKIVIQNPELREFRFSGRANNISIEKLLDILRKIQPFEYEIRENTVIIQ